MSESELASVLFAVLIELWRGITITDGPSSGARLKLCPIPANLERDLTDLTGDLWRKMSSQHFVMLARMSGVSYLVVAHLELM